MDKKSDFNELGGKSQNSGDFDDGHATAHLTDINDSVEDRPIPV